MTTSPSRGSNKSILIGDAGVLVAFIAGNQIGVLRAICAGKNFILQVPDQVDSEVIRVVKRKAGSAGNLRAWEAMKSMGLVVVLREPTVGSFVANQVAAYLGVRSGVKPSSDKDLGEYYVISHALDLRNNGQDVAVAIDDADARTLARQKFLEVLSTEQLLDFAILLDVFPTVRDLSNCYGEIEKETTLRPFAETLLGAHQLKREAER